MEAWTQERVRDIQKYIEENNVSVAQAAKDLKFSMASYYDTKKKMNGGPRKYTRRGPRPSILSKPAERESVKPITLEMASPTSSSKIVFIVTNDPGQLRKILNEVF